MADLATLAEFKTFLGVSGSSDDTLLGSILDSTEAMFERECGRALVPFVAAQTGRAELLDGVGSDALWLDYSVAVLTSVTLGYDHADPDETLTVADLVYGVGSRRVVRLDGWFGPFAAPRYVKVTYNTQDDLPADAKLAVLTGAATLYQRRGSEGVKSETAGPYSVTYRDDAQTLQMPPVWAMAVANHTRVL